MSRVKGTANLSASLEVLAGAPLDSRTIVPTESDLTNASNFPYRYVGMPVVVQETGIMYILLNLDVTDAKNWKKVGSEEDIKNSAFDLIGTSSTLEGSIITTQDVIDKYDFLVIKVNMIDDNNVETTRGTQLLCPCSQLTSVDRVNIVNGGNYVNGMTGGNVTYLYAYLNNTGLTYWYAKFNGSTGVVSNPKYICRLYGLKLSGTGVNYSTSEKKVGTWIDGNPIYQKTVDCGALPNATTKLVAHGISNLDHMVGLEGYAQNGTTSISIPYISTSGTDYAIAIDIDDTNINIFTRDDRSNLSGYITIRYTKTTDTPA